MSRVHVDAVLCKCLMLVVVAVVLSACGGAGPSPSPRSISPGAIVGMPVYIPFVEECSVLGVPTQGAVLEVEFSLVLGSGAPEKLYVHDSADDPYPDWFYGWAQSISVLWPLESARQGYVTYDGSGTIVHHLLMPEPGEYTLNYLSAVSPQAAGTYDLYGTFDPSRVVLRSLIIVVTS